MRKLVQYLFRSPLLWIINKQNVSINPTKVFTKLTNLYHTILDGTAPQGMVLPIHNATDRVVIMSDMHKGNGNAADDFDASSNLYTAACYHYLNEEYTMVALGDVEELWENNMADIIANNEANIAVEKLFVQQNKLIKIYGNHDIDWASKKFAEKWLPTLYGCNIPVYEGVVLQTKINDTTLNILLTHGHQGDKLSDGNSWSRWFVYNVWSKIQAYFDIHINTPSLDFLLRDFHNRTMYQWSTTQENAVLITGHTHKPVFAGLNHIEQINKEILESNLCGNTEKAKQLEILKTQKLRDYIQDEPYTPKSPTYFNTGCCCYNDGDLTVIEISSGYIRLVKWETKADGTTHNYIKHAIALQEIMSAK